jgi:hypothetical protein
MNNQVSEYMGYVTVRDYREAEKHFCSGYNNLNCFFNFLSVKQLRNLAFRARFVTSNIFLLLLLSSSSSSSSSYWHFMFPYLLYYDRYSVNVWHDPSFCACIQRSVEEMFSYNRTIKWMVPVWEICQPQVKKQFNFQNLKKILCEHEFLFQLVRNLCYISFGHAFYSSLSTETKHLEALLRYGNRTSLLATDWHVSSLVCPSSVCFRLSHKSTRRGS